MAGALIDSGWAAWLPFELIAALDAAAGGRDARSAFRRLLARPPDAERTARFERFALVAPSRLDLPADAADLDEATCLALLEQLGLVAGDPPRTVPPEPVEVVLTLDHDDVRELERIRGARDIGDAAPLPPDLPSLDNVFGKGTGRNDPCPCGSGMKYKRCHGR